LWLSDSETHDNQSSAAVAPTDECGVRPSQTADRIETVCGREEFEGDGRMTASIMRQQKVQAVLLSGLMIMAVMGMGLVAISGTAAAASSANAVGASIAANPAETDAVDAHVAILEVDASGSEKMETASGGGTDSFNISFDGTSDVDYSSVTAGDIIFETIKSDGTTQESFSAAGDFNIDTNSADGTLEISLDSGGGPSGTIDLTTIDYVRVVVSANVAHDTIDTDADDLSARIALDLTDGNDDGVIFADTAELALGAAAPVTLDTSSSGNLNYSSLQQAVGDLAGGTERITIDGNVSAFESQPTAIDSLAAADLSSKSDLIIAGEGDPTVTFADESNAGIDLNQGDNVTIRDISFAASDVAGDFDFAAIVTSSGASDALTIENNTFSDFAGSDVIDVTTGGAVNNLSITDNTLEVGATNGITVEAQLNDDNGEFLNVSGNTITYTGANTGLGLTVDEDSTTPTDVTIDGNEIVGDGSDGTGISLAGSTATLSLADNSVDNIATGLSLGSGSQSTLTLSDLTLANISGTTPVGVDATGTLASGAAVTIDGLAVDTSSGATAVAVDDDIDLTVVDSTIADVSEAVDVTSAKAVTITNTTITGASGNQAVHIDKPGASASITIDGKTAIDQTDGDAIEVDLGDTENGQTVTIDDVTLNGSTGAGVQVVDLDDDGGTSATVDITNSTFSDNGIGLDVDDATKAGATLRAHFNTFDANTKGVDVADLDSANGGFEVNVTFNDYRNSGEDGVVVANQNKAGTVNAWYSY
jgi:hypothetical protein